MITNPMEECPPDDPLYGFTIRAKQSDNGVWSVSCPEWKCELHHRNLTLCVAALVAEIADHNDECDGKVTYRSNPVAWAKENGLPNLKPESWPKPPRPKFGVRA